MILKFDLCCQSSRVGQGAIVRRRDPKLRRITRSGIKRRFAGEHLFFSTYTLNYVVCPITALVVKFNARHQIFTQNVRHSAIIFSKLKCTDWCVWRIEKRFISLYSYISSQSLQHLKVFPDLSNCSRCMCFEEPAWEIAVCRWH
jgi:hypothetical protein